MSTIYAQRLLWATRGGPNVQTALRQLTRHMGVMLCRNRKNEPQAVCSQKSKGVTPRHIQTVTKVPSVTSQKSQVTIERVRHFTLTVQTIFVLIRGSSSVLLVSSRI